jgi:hypothetical protein
MLSRRAVLAGAIGFVAGPLGAHTQSVGKIRRIGYLSLSPVTETWADRLGALREGLRALGYMEGESISIEVSSRRSSSW